MTVREMFLELIPQLSKIDPAKQVDFVAAVNKSIHALFMRLLKHGRGADFIRADLSLVITDGKCPLPLDFWGLHGRPWVSGRKTSLDPLSNDDLRIQYEGRIGPASLYELENNFLILYPKPATGTLLGKYYQHPAALTAMTATIPWDGRFDEILNLSVLALNANGLSFASSKDFEILLTNHLDDILPLRNNLQRRVKPSYF